MTEIIMFPVPADHYAEHVELEHRLQVDAQEHDDSLRGWDKETWLSLRRAYEGAPAHKIITEVAKAPDGVLTAEIMERANLDATKVKSTLSGLSRYIKRFKG